MSQSDGILGTDRQIADHTPDDSFNTHWVSYGIAADATRIRHRLTTDAIFGTDSALRPCLAAADQGRTSAPHDEHTQFFRAICPAEGKGGGFRTRTAA